MMADKEEREGYISLKAWANREEEDLHQASKSEDTFRVMMRVRGHSLSGRYACRCERALYTHQ